MYVAAYGMMAYPETLFANRRVTKCVPIEKKLEMSDGSVVTRTESSIVSEIVPITGVVVTYRFEDMLGTDFVHSFFAPIHCLDAPLSRPERLEEWVVLRRCDGCG